MKKLKLNKQTVSILGTTEKKMIAGGETDSSPCLNWTSYLKSACDRYSCAIGMTNCCPDPVENTLRCG